jgi:hypothetical protein
VVYDEDDAPDEKKISLYFRGGIKVKTLFPKYGDAIPQEIINHTQNHSITLEEVSTTNAVSNKAMMIIVWNMKLHLVKQAISDGTIPYSIGEHLRNWWIAQRTLWKSGHTETDKLKMRVLKAHGLTEKIMLQRKPLEVANLCDFWLVMLIGDWGDIYIYSCFTNIATITIAIHFKSTFSHFVTLTYSSCNITVTMNQVNPCAKLGQQTIGTTLNYPHLFSGNFACAIPHIIHLLIKKRMEIGLKGRGDNFTNKKLPERSSWIVVVCQREL